MTKHGIAKRYGVNRAERNSILKVILIEEEQLRRSQNIQKRAR